MKEQIELRISYTENQLLTEQKELRKVQDRIKYLEGELQGYKNILDDIEQSKKELENDTTENN